MQIESLTMPSVYVKLILNLCKSRGLDIESVAQRFDSKVLEDPHGRFNMLDAGTLLYQAALQNEAIGYEIGLKSQLTMHGFVGYGLLTNATYSDALNFAIRYSALRTPFMQLKYRCEEDVGIIEIQETFNLEPTRRQCMEFYLIGAWRIAQMLVEATGLKEIGFEMHFQHSEPEYHDQYRSQLPQCHFSSAANQLRFPAEYMDFQLATADEMAALIAAKECEREQVRTSESTHTMTSRVKTLFEESAVPPTLGETADRLHVSARSLKRKLQADRTSYQLLLDKHREQRAIERLRNSNLSVTKIAEELGYTAPENFTRAFRKWTGMSPSEMRSLLLGE